MASPRTIISLPLALAFGVASGAGAEAGLWGAIMVGLFASLFGGSNTLISEPTDLYDSDHDRRVD